MAPLYFGPDTYFGPHTYFGGPPTFPFLLGPPGVLGPTALLGVPDKPLGAPFLIDQFGEAGRLVVEAAFGADLTADPDLWTWTDLSHDVRHDDKITCKLGRGNEASKSQPASLSLTLDNRAARYSLGPASPLYPGVRRNTPIRVRVNTGTGGEDGSGVLRLLWQGGANSWSPAWDITGRDATVELSASGTLRRLAQGKADKPSVLRRSLPHVDGLIAYWPAEDGAKATSIAPGLDTHGPMAIIGRPALEQSEAVDASSKLPYIAASQWIGIVPGYHDTGQLQVRFALAAEDEGTYPKPTGRLATLHFGPGSTFGQIVCFYDTNGDGGVFIVGYPRGDDLVILSSVTPLGPVKEQPQGVSIDLRQEGADVRWQLTHYFPGSPILQYFTGTATGTLGQLSRIVVGDSTSAVLGLTAVGHITVRNEFSPATDWELLSAFSGELADTRIRRLCAESGIPVDVRGGSATRMGVQKPGGLVDLLRECESADQGVLLDGLGPGLTYITRQRRETRPTAMTIDVAQGQLAKELAPVDDDARSVNVSTITRKGGSKVTVSDDTGPLGTTAIGVYDDSDTVNINSDTRIEDYASWAVHLGTAEGYRLPGLQLNLAASPELADAWLALLPSSRVDLTHVNARRTQLDDATISLLLEGYTQTLSQFEWTVKANTSPERSWRVGFLYLETAGPVPNELRAQADGATLTGGALPGATSLTVATTSGPLWTTDPDDYPLSLDVAGRQVVATACTGEASPQTFTVQPLVAVAEAGAPVGLWRSLPLAL